MGKSLSSAALSCTEQSHGTITNAATKVETPLIVLFCFFTTTMNKPLKYDEIAGKVDNLGLSR